MFAKLLKVVGAGALILTIVGCSLVRPPYKDVVLSTNGEGNVVVAVCDEITLTSATLSVLGSGSWDVIGEFDGRQQIESGVPVLVSDLFGVDIDPVGQVKLQLYEFRTEIANPVFTFSDEGEGNEEWLSPDGSRMDQPCS